MADIPEIELHPTPHIGDFRRVTTGPIDLSPSGNAGFHRLATIIVVDELAVILVMGEGVRARPDQRHVALENIDELRQLVDAGPAKPAADPRHPAVVALRLLNDASVLHDFHGSELDDLEGMAVEAPAALPEEDRAAGIELDRKGNEDQQGQQ